MTDWRLEVDLAIEHGGGA